MNLNKAKILDAARWRPPQRIVKVPNAAGVMLDKIEKLPGTRFERWLTPNGNVVSLSLGNANATAEAGKVPYYDQQRRAKIAAGWLPWGRCPVAMVAAQELSTRALRDETLLEQGPCMSANHSAANPCPHAIAERSFRLARHGEHEAAKAAAYKQQAELDREQRERHHTETVEALRSGQVEALRAVLSEMRDDPKPSGGNGGGRNR